MIPPRLPPRRRRPLPVIPPRLPPRRRRPLPEERVYIQGVPRENDVIAGQGGGMNLHPGNIAYLNSILEWRETYWESQTNAEKNTVALEIVDFIRSQNGRFVQMENGEINRWFVLPDKFVIRKVKQALRDRYVPTWARNFFPEERVYIQGVPRENDVIVGRGAGMNLHPGNMQYWRSILAHREMYRESRTNEGKHTVALGVVNSIRRRNGRFLRMENGEINRWFVLPDNVVISKVKLALRDSYIPPRARRWARRVLRRQGPINAI